MHWAPAHRCANDIAEEQNDAVLRVNGRPGRASPLLAKPIDRFLIRYWAFAWREIPISLCPLLAISPYCDIKPERLVTLLSIS